ncbi:MAG: rhomboid family intramembrane serine protease [Granulosicoccus sp.]
MITLVDSRNVHTVKRDLMYVAMIIAVMWVVFVLDYFLPLETFGLVPRTVKGLTGIVAMPFLHGDFKHLLGNTVPLAVTMMLLAGSRANSLAIVMLITLLCGVGLWLFGREALHIGASGVVFGLIAFHVFAGVFEKRLQSVIIAVVVGLLYASTVVRGVIPFQPGVSWEGHLIGALAGAMVAMTTARSLQHSPVSNRRRR